MRSGNIQDIHSSHLDHVLIEEIANNQSSIVLPNGNTARAHSNGKISITDHETNKVIIEYSNYIFSEFPVGHLVLNPSTKNLVVYFKNNYLVEFEITNKNLEFNDVYKIPKRKKLIPVTCITITPQGNFVYGYADGKIEMFDKNKRLHAIKIKDSRILSVIYGQNEHIICSTSNQIIILDSTLNIVNQFFVPYGNNKCIAVLDNGDIEYSCDNDNHIIKQSLSDLRITNMQQPEPAIPLAKIIATTILLDGNVARAHQDRKITIINNETAEITGPFDASFSKKSKSAIKDIAAHPETGNIVVFYANSFIQEFENTNNNINSVKKFAITARTLLDKITCFAILSNGDIAYGYEHGRIEIFNKKLQSIALFDAKSSGHVTSIDYNAKGHYICTVNNTIKIFDTNTPDTYQKLPQTVEIMDVENTAPVPAKKRYAQTDVEGEQDRPDKKTKIDMIHTLFNPARFNTDHMDENMKYQTRSSL